MLNGEQLAGGVGSTGVPLKDQKLPRTKILISWLRAVLWLLRHASFPPAMLSRLSEQLLPFSEDAGAAWFGRANSLLQCHCSLACSWPHPLDVVLEHPRWQVLLWEHSTALGGLRGLSLTIAGNHVT